MHTADYARCVSVCLSVRPSVEHRYSVETVFSESILKNTEKTKKNKE